MRKIVGKEEEEGSVFPVPAVHEEIVKRKEPSQKHDEPVVPKCSLLRTRCQTGRPLAQ